MDVKGKITIFPRKVEVKDGEDTKVKVYCTGSISTKKEDGSYINKSVDVSFSTKFIPEEKLQKLDENLCYELDIKSGFLRCVERTYKGDTIRDIGIMVTDGKLLSSKSYERKEKEVQPANDDLPF